MVWLILCAVILIVVFVIAWNMSRDWPEFFVGYAIFSIPLLLLNTFINSIAYTGVCDRKIQFWLNQPVSGYVENGLQFMAPMFDTESFDVCRRQVEMVGENTLRGSAKGGIQMEVMDTIIPLRIKPEHLWRVRATIGGESELMELFHGSTRSAGRAIQSKYEWRDIVYEKRDQFERDFSTELAERLKVDLIGAGLTEHEAANVFVIPAVRLRDVQPSKAVLDEQANFEQAKVQQETAKVRVETSKSDGQGINEFIDNMTIKPTSVGELAIFLQAFADLERARALARISTDDKKNVSVMVLPSTSSVALPTPLKQ